MRFAPTGDQLALRDAMRGLLADRCPPGAVRQAWEAPTAAAFDRDLWQRLADMGVTGLLAPGSAGGSDLSEVELVLALEEAGYAALPGPLAEHAGVAVPLLRTAVDAGQADLAPLLAKAAAGQVVLTAGGHGAAVAWAGVADRALLARDGTVYDVAEVQARERDTVDRAYRAADVTWSSGTALTGVSGEDLRDRGALVAAAQLVGLGVRLLELAVAHVTVRTQFGVPVGSQQAVKHHLANVRIGLEYARPVVWRAAYSVAHGEPGASRDCSFAKVYAGDAAWRAAKASLQCHGAIGYTAEHDLHLFLKRVWALDAAWGTRAVHRRRVADAVLGP